MSSSLPPLWDYPLALQGRCRIIAGSVWLAFGAGFLFLLVVSWGSLSLTILLWALAAVPTAIQMIRWLRTGGGFRVVLARLLLASSAVLAVSAVIFFVPLVDWKRPAPYVVMWFPPTLSLCGAVLGFLGRGKRRSIATRRG